MAHTMCHIWHIYTIFARGVFGSFCRTTELYNDGTMTLFLQQSVSTSHRNIPLAKIQYPIISSYSICMNRIILFFSHALPRALRTYSSETFQCPRYYSPCHVCSYSTADNSTHTASVRATFVLAKMFCGFSLSFSSPLASVNSEALTEGTETRNLKYICILYYQYYTMRHTQYVQSIRQGATATTVMERSACKAKRNETKLSVLISFLSRLCLAFLRSNILP